MLSFAKIFVICIVHFVFLVKLYVEVTFRAVFFRVRSVRVKNRVFVLGFMYSTSEHLWCIFVITFIYIGD